MSEVIELLKIKLLGLMEVTSEDMMYRRLNGLDWGADAYTMIGMRRLDNIEYCVREIFNNNIPGDFIETGVWKGGACILMAALVREFGQRRNVILADIFDGDFPVPTNPQDQWAAQHDFSQLACSMQQVEENFKRFDLGASNVRLIKGWFKDTLPGVPGPLALIRLDGDLYESTMDGLVHLYDKLSPGGFVIIDDWGIESSRNAVLDFITERNLTVKIKHIDSMGAYFKK